MAASQLPQRARVTGRARSAQTLTGRQQFLLIEPLSKNAVDLLKLALRTPAGSRSSYSLCPSIGKLRNLFAPSNEGALGAIIQAESSSGKGFLQPLDQQLILL